MFQTSSASTDPATIIFASFAAALAPFPHLTPNTAAFKSLCLPPPLRLVHNRHRATASRCFPLLRCCVCCRCTASSALRPNRRMRPQPPTTTSSYLRPSPRTQPRPGASPSTDSHGRHPRCAAAAVPWPPISACPATGATNDLRSEHLRG